MSIRWYEGWEQYGIIANAGSKWDTNGCVIVQDPSPVRTGDYAVRMSNTLPNMRRSLAGDFDKVGLALGYYMEGYPIRPRGGNSLMQFRNSFGRAHMNVKISTTGRVQIYGNGYDTNLSPSDVFLAESTEELQVGTWNFISAVLLLDNSSGFLDIEVNGRSWVRYDGDTVRAPEGNEFCAEVGIGHFAGSYQPSFSKFTYVDDVVAQVKVDGSDDVDHLPLCGAYYLPPVQDGLFSQFTLTAGVDGFALLNEIPPDGDATYIFTNTVGNKSSFVPDNLPANVTGVLAIMPVGYARKSDSGASDVDFGLISGGNEYYISDQPLTEAYSYNADRVFEEDPDTSSAWDPLNLPEMIVKRTG